MIVRKVINSNYYAKITISTCDICGRGGWLRYRTSSHDYRCRRCKHVITIPPGELDLGALIHNKDMRKAQMDITLF